MNLYLISQHSNDDWDTYDSAVVVARDKEQAKQIHPNGQGKKWWDLPPKEQSLHCDWVRHPNEVSVLHIGKRRQDLKMREGTVICASFRAG